MAPSTRLRAQLEHNVDHGREPLTDRSEPSGDPILLEDTPPPQAQEPSRRPGSFRYPILLEDTPPPQEQESLRRSGSFRYPILLEDTPPPQGQALLGRPGLARYPTLPDNTPPPQAQAPSAANSNRKSTTKWTRDESGRFTKIKSTVGPDRKKVVKVRAPPEPKKKLRPEEKECIICNETKKTRDSFKAAELESVCEHFMNICDSCIQRQIKTKIAERQLGDAHLPCMFTECTAILSHLALKYVMTKALFQLWDTGATEQFLTDSPSYIACLNTKCGIYFSIEDCGSKHNSSSMLKSNPEPRFKNTSEGLDRIVCPYCQYEVCSSCNRPWHSGSCSSVKQRENEESEQTIKDLGAKLCPKCGVNIEKLGGCDHMKCQRCGHIFCWQCLNISNGDPSLHAESCSHRRPVLARVERFFRGADIVMAHEE